VQLLPKDGCVVKQYHLPWQLKIAAKLVLSVSRRLLNKVGLFNPGGMEKPQYALGVFRRYFQNAVFARKNQHFVALELGPANSVYSLIIANAFGASSGYAVDVGPFARVPIDEYKQLEVYLRHPCHDAGISLVCSEPATVITSPMVSNRLRTFRRPRSISSFLTRFYNTFVEGTSFHCLPSSGVSRG
jgi:hypothetical protein